MSIKKVDVKMLIERAKEVLRCLDREDPSYSLLERYISEAEEILPEIKGKLTSVQKEIYDRLEAAVGP